MQWEIYKNVKALREGKNMTIEELAEKSGVKVQKIKNIEKEQTFEHNIEDIARLANVLGVTVDDFMCQKFYD